MPHADFVHLRVHSAFSLSEGALKIGELVDLCKAGEMPAVAITDTGNMFGAMEFSLACRGAGIQPIIGCQMAVAREHGPDPRNGVREHDTLILLVQNEAGYRNLLHLVSRSYLDSDPGEPPHIALADLESASDGLIALTGGPAGALGRLLGGGQADAAGAALARLAALFPGRLYVELMRHGAEEERRIEDRLIDLANSQDLPLVATNEAFFSDESMYEAHDALVCVAEGTYVAEQDRRRLTPDHRFKSAQEMRALFADIPEAVDNTLVVAQRCAFMAEERAPILPAFATEGGRDEAEQLRDAAKAGLEARLATHVFGGDTNGPARDAAAKPYRERLDYELGVIRDMGFPGYFLIVADFIQWAKEC
ncbi:MAG: PHP domain-containing protein [Pseudomonadota bacterium]